MPVDFNDYIEQLVLEEITGVISPEDHLKLMELIAKDPKAKAIWDELNVELPDNYMTDLEEKLAGKLSADSILRQVREKEKNKRRKLFRHTLAYLAAAVLLLGIVKVLWWPAPEVTPPSILENTITTRAVSLEVPGKGTFTLNKRFDTLNLGIVTVYKNEDTLSWVKGEKVTAAQATIPRGTSLCMRFPDGSKIWMNAGSSIKFPMAFNSNIRQLSIKGEAYADVAPDPLRPFIVEVPNAKISVLGTAFGINTIDSGKVAVSLIRGKIQFKTMKDSLLLTPGLSVKFEQGKKLSAVSFDTASLLKTQKGIYTFDKATLGEITNVLARIRSVHIVIKNEVDKMKFTGPINMKAPLSKILGDINWKNSEMKFKIYVNEKDTVIHLLR